MSKRYTWIMLMALFLAAVAAPVNQYKVPPVMPVLMDVFGLDLTSANLLMSVFSVAGLVLAIPAGLIVQRIGPKRSGLIAIVSVILGSALGALSGGAAMLLASRAIEGLSFVLMMVVAPALIAVWFTSEERGVPMGIFAIWVPAGSMIMLNIAPALVAQFGWQSVWWFGCAYGVMAFLVFWAHGQDSRARSPERRTLRMQDQVQVQLDPRAWRLSVELWPTGMSGCWGWSSSVSPCASRVSWPACRVSLHIVRGYPLATAGFVVSLSSLDDSISCPLGMDLGQKSRFRKCGVHHRLPDSDRAVDLPLQAHRCGHTLFMIVFGVFAPVSPLW